MQQYSDTEPTYQELLKVDANALRDGSPVEIKPKGLDLKRQWYLYNTIREFVASEKQDLVCPLPETPMPTVSSDVQSKSDDESAIPQPRKSARRGRSRAPRQ